MYAILRTALRIALIVAFAYGVHLLIDWVLAKAEMLPPGSQKLMLNSLIVLMLVSYALLMSVPFVPGIEIGLSLMILRGAPIMPFIYVSTVLGLSIAYFAGRYIRYEWLRKILTDVGLSRASDFLERIQTLPQERRLDLMYDRLPDWLGPHLIRWRYIVLALLLNLPGNMIIGGGGGISLISGLSRIFSPLPTIITFALAVAPVPIFVWYFDIDFLRS